MTNNIISLQKLTAPAAIVVSTAWVFVEKGAGDGLIFLLFVGLFYILLLIFEGYFFHGYD